MKSASLYRPEIKEQNEALQKQRKKYELEFIFHDMKHQNWSKEII